MKPYFLGLFLCLAPLLLFGATKEMEAAKENTSIEILSENEISFDLEKLKETPIAKEVVIQNNTSNVKELFIAAQKEEVVSSLSDIIIIEVHKKNEPQTLLETYLTELFQTASNNKLPVITTIKPGEKISLWITARIDPKNEVPENETLNFSFVFGFLGNILEQAAVITPQENLTPEGSLNSLLKDTALLTVNVSPMGEKSFLAQNVSNQDPGPSLFAEADRYFALSNIYFIALIAVAVLLLIYFYIRSQKKTSKGERQK